MALSWTKRLEGNAYTLPLDTAADLCVDSVGNVYLFLTNRLYKSTDNGVNWTDKGAIGSGNAKGIGVLGSTLYAAVETGDIFSIYYSADAGENWTITTVDPPHSGSYIHFYFYVSQYYERVYVTCRNPAWPYTHPIAYYTDNDGESWSATSTGQNNTKYSLAGDESGNMVALLTYGGYSTAEAWYSNDGISFSAGGMDPHADAHAFYGFGEIFYAIGYNQSTRFSYSIDVGLNFSYSDLFPVVYNSSYNLYHMCKHDGIIYVAGHTWSATDGYYFPTLHTCDNTGTSGSMVELCGIAQNLASSSIRGVIVAGDKIIVLTELRYIYTAEYVSPAKPRINYFNRIQPFILN